MNYCTCYIIKYFITYNYCITRSIFEKHSFFSLRAKVKMVTFLNGPAWAPIVHKQTKTRLLMDKQLTFTRHAHSQTLLKPAGLTTVSTVHGYITLFIVATLVAHALSYASPEKPLYSTKHSTFTLSN